MEAGKLSWPTDRRLFRRSRLSLRGLPTLVVAILAIVLAYGLSGLA